MRAARTALVASGTPADTLVTREPQVVFRSDRKRPDGLTVCPWKRGRPLLWDFTCRDTLAKSYLRQTALTAGAAASGAEAKKRSIYSVAAPLYHFIPIGAETLGAWGLEGFHLLKELGSRIAATTEDPRACSFLFQRLSIAICRGNAAAIIGSLPTTPPLDELFLFDFFFYFGFFSFFFSSFTLRFWFLCCLICVNFLIIIL